MTSQLSVALRAAAAGIHPDEAAAGLIISHAAFLHRDDFTGHIETAASISDGTPMAWINWYYGRGFPPGGGAAAQRDVWLPGAVHGVTSFGPSLVILSCWRAAGRCGRPGCSRR